MKIRPQKKLSGSEPFHTNSHASGLMVLDFWQWAFSRLNSNMLRGVLAEFIVLGALVGKDEIDIREPWADVDLQYRGSGIEVKSAAFVQEWEQPIVNGRMRLSRICFSRLKAKHTYEPHLTESAIYKADVYVMALLTTREAVTLDVLDLNQWSFYVIPRHVAQAIAGKTGNVSLTCLERSGIAPVSYGELRPAIDRLLGVTATG